MRMTPVMGHNRALPAQERIRVDQLLVERGLTDSRHKAQAMVMAGEVLVDEQKAEKPGKQVSKMAEIRLLGRRSRFVSRAGQKLEAALDRFSVDVCGAVCLDIGASTGGFTDCLLQRGARRVYAVDVGTAQLHWRIRRDERVTVLEKVNARHLTIEHVPEPIDFACCDVSFISCTMILPCLPPLLAPGAQIAVLAKPQFEVEKGEVGKGGIVRSDVLHARVVEKVRRAVIALGFAGAAAIDSPILGAAGNKEFLLYAADRPAAPAESVK